MIGDDLCFYHKQIGRKSSNAAWITIGETLIAVTRRTRFAPRALLWIFFKMTGPVLIHHVLIMETPSIIVIILIIA